MNYEKLELAIKRELDRRDKQRINNRKFNSLLQDLKKREIRLERQEKEIKKAILPPRLPKKKRNEYELIPHKFVKFVDHTQNADSSREILSMIGGLLYG